MKLRQTPYTFASETPSHPHNITQLRPQPPPQFARPKPIPLRVPVPESSLNPAPSPARLSTTFPKQPPHSFPKRQSTASRLNIGPRRCMSRDHSVGCVIVGLPGLPFWGAGGEHGRSGGRRVAGSGCGSYINMVSGYETSTARERRIGQATRRDGREGKGAVRKDGSIIEMGLWMGEMRWYIIVGGLPSC